jgi:hypothetical protein
MPNKRSNVKNEKQYEALKDKGMSKQRAARIANSSGVKPRRQELEFRIVAFFVLPGRHHRSEESRRPQGRQGDGSQELLEGRAKASKRSGSKKWVGERAAAVSGVVESSRCPLGRKRQRARSLTGSRSHTSAANPTAGRPGRGGGL